MSDIDTLRQTWREDEGTAEPSLTGDELMQILRDRTVATRDRLTRRLAKELGVYSAMFAGALGILIAEAPSGWRAGAALILVVYAATGGVIFVKNRALQRIPLEGTLRDALTRMIALLSGWMTLYLFAYVAIIAGGVALMLTALSRDWSPGPSWAFAAAGTGLAVWWGYTSGQAYLRREFAGHRDELRQALRDLET